MFLTPHLGLLVIALLFTLLSMLPWPGWHYLLPLAVILAIIAQLMPK